jgi:putative endonuclease
MSAYLYILRCADGSYYVGTRRGDLETRVGQHHAGTFDGYTARRRPVELVFAEEFERIQNAISAERKVKGWQREKKEALIRGDYAALPGLSRRTAKPTVRASRRDLTDAPDKKMEHFLATIRRGSAAVFLQGGSAAGRWGTQHEEPTQMASFKRPHPEPARGSAPSRRTHGADPE